MKWKDKRKHCCHRKVALLTFIIIVYYCVVLMLLVESSAAVLELSSSNSEGVVWPLWSNLKMGPPSHNFQVCNYSSQ